MILQGEAFLTQELMANSYHCDFKGQLSLPAMLRLFQEVAWEHATLNRFGYEHLLEQGLFWALARIRVVVHRLPAWAQRFTLTTWPSGTQGLFALRDYRIHDMQGQLLVGAASSWLALDLHTRRPRRLEELKGRMPICDAIRATHADPQKVTIPSQDAVFTQRVRAGVHDIDVNGHTNNTKYVEWGLNAFPLERYKDMAVSEMEIEYLSESFCGEECEVRVYGEPAAGYPVSITRIADARRLAALHLRVQ